MQYRLISAYSLNDLERMVQIELAHNWEITGGLIAFSEHHIEKGFLVERNRNVFAQAMIKHGAPNHMAK